MEANLRWMAVTAIAPIAWGSNYYVTRQFLPSGYPLYGAALRALPAGLILLVLARRRPRGSWWWKSAVLGVLNVGAFFVLIYIAAKLLPSSLASTLMALSAAVMMLLGWVLLSERPRLFGLVGALTGLVGVGIMLWSDTASVNPLGVLASLAAMLMSSSGYILTKRWGQGVDTLALTAWQLIAGGLVVVPIAIVGEGSFPHLGRNAVVGFVYVSLVATALAFTAWFAGLRRLDAATVGLIGLLNPVTGVVLGSIVASESFGPRAAIGAGLVILGVVIGQRRMMPPASRAISGSKLASRSARAVATSHTCYGVLHEDGDAPRNAQFQRRNPACGRGGGDGAGDQQRAGCGGDIPARQRLAGSIGSAGSGPFGPPARG